MSFWEMQKITVSVNMIDCWKSGSYWDFRKNKTNYESFAVYQQNYIEICHNNSKQWKKAQKAMKSLKKMSSNKDFFFIFANRPTQKETNCIGPHGRVIKSFQLSAHNM